MKLSKLLVHIMTKSNSYTTTRQILNKTHVNFSKYTDTMIISVLFLILCVILCGDAVILMDAIGTDNAKAISDALARPDGMADLNKIGRGGQTPLMHAGK